MFALSLPLFLILQRTKGLPVLNQLILAAPVVLGLAAAGGLMMRKKWGLVLEFIRVPLFIFVVFAMVSVLRRDIMITATAIAAAVGIIQLVWVIFEYRKGDNALPLVQMLK